MVVEDEAVVEEVADRVVGGLIGSRLGDVFLASLRAVTGWFDAASLPLTVEFRTERVRLMPVVEDMIHGKECFQDCRIFRLFTDLGKLRTCCPYTATPAPLS